MTKRGEWSFVYHAIRVDRLDEVTAIGQTPKSHEDDSIEIGAFMQAVKYGTVPTALLMRQAICGLRATIVKDMFPRRKWWATKNLGFLKALKEVAPEDLIIAILVTIASFGVTVANHFGPQSPTVCSPMTLDWPVNGPLVNGSKITIH